MIEKLKTRKDFATESEYLDYTKSMEFLFGYSWENKSKSEIIYDMALEDYEIEYLERAMEDLKKKNDFSGMALDRYILKLIDMNEKEDDFNEEDVIFLEEEE